MRFAYATLVAAIFTASAFAQQETPKASDPRLVVELFAASPDIVHPISCDVDAKGRLLVIESHTHFAPKDYKGPKFDRIRMFEMKPPKAQGQQSLGIDKVTTFFEGTRHTMDLAVHPDGSVYIATRNEILRLRDTKGVGVADEKTRIVFLDTKGDYPHNGLSGLCFDSKGDLTFGMGENLGAKYTLSGADGVKFTGEGDGGHIFHCTADGKKLRKIATGFWNPFGICRDIYGRMFCVDNDPDQAPPCRMVHVVEGGDYGFRFCYGRSGKHPFQSWHGTLPGTLPMMTGVGEAPCEILSYESDGLPAEYRGQLLVTSWADHRVERYQVKPHGASFKAERLPFVQGGNNFRPVGLCTAPDGSLFVSDWVLPNYNLHGKGAIWRIRWKDEKQSRERKRPADPKEAIFSMHRPLREAAARKLASSEGGRDFLLKQMGHGEARVRATAASALAESQRYLDLRAFEKYCAALKSIVNSDAEVGLREMAVRALFDNGNDVRQFASEMHQSAVRVAAVRSLALRRDKEMIIDMLTDKDPFVRLAGISQWTRDPDDYLYLFGWAIDLLGTEKVSPKERLAQLLVARAVLPEGWIESQKQRIFVVRPFLLDSDETVRFLAVKWIADEKLAGYRKDIEKGMTDSKLSVRMYLAYATALARLDGQEVSETRLAEYFAKRLADDATPATLRAMLLRQVPATHGKLTLDLLGKLVTNKDDALKLEAVRALVEHPNAKRGPLLLDVLRNRDLGAQMRAHALLGLTDRPDLADEFIGLMRDPQILVRQEAMRALIGVKLTKKQSELLMNTLPNTVSIDLAERVLGGKFFRPRPAAKDIDGWLKHLGTSSSDDPDAGARVFFHPKLGGCFKCHRIDGRGQDVGPDLSTIGNTDRRHILESILQPSNTVAPHYVAWHLETADGKVRNGMLLHTNLDEYTYLDAKGGRFKLRTGDLVEQRPLTTSIMPEALADTMTDQELRDLLAYLQARK
jgi:putative membrane-bound dehydrogenase-like protein